MELFKAKLGSPVTQLAGNITSTQTTISLVNAGVLPAAPNIATIGTGVNAETVRYSGKSLNTLTGVTRGFTGTAKAWTSGQPIARIFTQYDHDSLVDEITTHKADYVTQIALKANKAQENWITATLQNGWTGTLGYAKNDLGLVTLYFALVAGAVTALTVISTIPTGYRPVRPLVMPMRVQSTGNYSGQGVFLNTAGSLSVPAGQTLVGGTIYEGTVTYYAG